MTARASRADQRHGVIRRRSEIDTADYANANPPYGLPSSLLILPDRLPFFGSRRQALVGACNLEKALSVFRLGVARHFKRLQRPLMPPHRVNSEIVIGQSAILASHP